MFTEHNDYAAPRLGVHTQVQTHFPTKLHAARYPLNFKEEAAMQAARLTHQVINSDVLFIDRLTSGILPLHAPSSFLSHTSPGSVPSTTNSNSTVIPVRKRHRCRKGTACKFCQSRKIRCQPEAESHNLMCK